MYDKIDSLEKYVSIVTRFINDSDYYYGFRGQSSVDYDLSPSINRGNIKFNEREITLNTIIKHPNMFNIKDHFGTISLLRHYDAPSRLLDLSWNPLVALFMALDGMDEKSFKDACVYVFQIKKDRIKYPNSDTVLVLSSLSFLNNKDNEKLGEYCKIKRNGILDAYCKKNMKAVKHLYHEICGEYPGFETEIRIEDLLSYFYVIPNQTDKRMIMQQGFFVLFGLDIENNVNKLQNDDCVLKIIIPFGKKELLLKQLKLCGIDKTTLYPGLENDIKNNKN